MSDQNHLPVDDPLLLVTARMIAGLDDAAAELARLRSANATLAAALEACDVVMDTASMHGLPQQLPEAYRDSWARAHVSARAALESLGESEVC